MASIGTVVIEVDADVARFVEGIHRTNRTLSQLERRANEAKRMISNFATATVGILAVAGAFEKAKAQAESFLRTASEFEQYKNRMSAFYQGTEKVNAEIGRATDFAKKYNVSINDTMDALIKMKVFGIEPTNRALEIFGNTAVGGGKSLDQFVEAMADAFQGENERLKEFGVKASVEGQKIAYAWSDSSGKARSVVIENNKKIIQSTLETIFNEKYVGQMQLRANSWAGFVDSIKNDYTTFKLAVMDDGLFTYIKAVTASFKKEWAESIGDTKSTAHSFSETFKEIFISLIKGTAVAIDSFYGIKIVFGSIKYAFKSMAISMGKGMNSIVYWWRKIMADMNNIYKQTIDGIGMQWHKTMDFIGLGDGKEYKSSIKFEHVKREDIAGVAQLEKERLETVVSLDKAYEHMKHSTQAMVEKILTRANTEEKKILKTNKELEAKRKKAKADMEKLLKLHKGTLATQKAGAKAGASSAKAKKAMIAEQKKALALAKKESDIAKEFQDKYNRATLTSFEYRKLMLKKEYENYRKHNINRLKLEKWYNIKLNKIESEELKQRLDKFIKTETLAYKQRLKNIKKANEARLKAIEEAKQKEKEQIEEISAMYKTVFNGIENNKNPFDIANGLLSSFNHKAIDKFSSLLGEKTSKALIGGLDFKKWSNEEQNTAIEGIAGLITSYNIQNNTQTAKQRDSVAIGTAIGTAIGAYYGGSLGASIGGALGSTVGSAIGGSGKKDKIYYSRDNYHLGDQRQYSGGLTYYTHKDGGLFGHDSNNIKIDRTYQVNQDYNKVLENYHDILTFIKSANTELNTSYIKEGKYDYKDLINRTTEQFFYQIMGVNEASEKAKKLYEEYYNASHNADNLGAIYNLESLKKQYEEANTNTEELYNKAKELQASWENYATYIDTDVGSAMSDAINRLKATSNTAYQELHKNDKELLFEHNLSLLQEQRTQLQDKIGGVEVTLENFDSTYQQLLETGKLTPEMSQNLIELGNALVQTSQETDRYTSYLNSLEDSYSQNFFTSEQNSIRDIKELQNSFRELGYTMPQTSQEFINLVENSGNARTSLLELNQAFSSTVGAAEQTIAGLRESQSRFAPTKIYTTETIYRDIENYSTIGNSTIEAEINSWYNQQKSALQKTATYQITIDNSHNKALNEQIKLANTLHDKIVSMQTEARATFTKNIINTNATRAKSYLSSSINNSNWNGVRDAYSSIVSTAQNSSSSRTEELLKIAFANAQIQSVQAPEKRDLLDTSIRTETHTRDISADMKLLDEKAFNMYQSLIEQNQSSLTEHTETVKYLVGIGASIDRQEATISMQEKQTRDMLGVNFQASTSLANFAISKNIKQDSDIAKLRDDFKALNAKLSTLIAEQRRANEIAEQQAKATAEMRDNDNIRLHKERVA